MILVTGSAGLIGHSVSKFLLKKKEKVFGIDNNQRKKFLGKWQCIKKYIRAEEN